MIQIPAPANSNFPAAKPGEAFYPEMGERHDGNALFVAQVGHGGEYLSWSTDRHADALAAFAKFRIRPRFMECVAKISGGKKWSCSVTWQAARKLQTAKLTVAELLL